MTESLNSSSATATEKWQKWAFGQRLRKEVDPGMLLTNKVSFFFLTLLPQ